MAFLGKYFCFLKLSATLPVYLFVSLPVNINCLSSYFLALKIFQGFSLNIIHQSTVSTESTTKRDQTQPNRQKKVMIAGDSVLKHLQGHKMSRNSRVKISSFPGCTTEDMHDFIKPLLRKNPDEIILHVGTNSLRSCDTPRACADEIIDLATMVSSESPAKIALSSLVYRSDDEALACKIAEVNRILKDFCTRKSWGFVDHSNISPRIT